MSPPSSVRPQIKIRSRNIRNVHRVPGPRTGDASWSEAADQPRTESQPGSTAGLLELEVTGPKVDTRYSLEDILQLENPADCEAPEEIPLPDSQLGTSASGSASDQFSDEESESSLNILRQAGTHIVPAFLALPPSQDSETVRLRNKRRRRKKQVTKQITYDNVIENASKALKHIENGNLKAKSRHEKASITFYDYLHDGSVYSEPVADASEIPSLGNRSDVRQRLIVVEDLSKRTIDTLGIQFKINPEFFEEHLLNSGYSGAHFNQPSPKTWNTASLQKSYVCMKWFRPVWRTPTYFSNRDLHDLLKDKTEHFTHRGTFITRAATNVFRPEWDLWTDPEKTIRVKRECGWEEKVSIWSGDNHGLDCQIVIVLLDPLPQISEQQSLVTKQSLNEAQKPDERSPLFAEITDEEGHETFVDIFARNGNDLPRRLNERGILFELWNRYYQRQKGVQHIEHEPVQRCIIEQMSPRKEVQVHLDQIFQNEQSTLDSGTYLTQTKSTRDELCDAFNPTTGHISLIFPFLKILCRDMLALLKLLHHTLDEMNVEILNDERMEDRLVLWRQLIIRAQHELPEFAVSVGPFAAFMAKIDPNGVYEEGCGNGLDGKLNLETLLEDIETTTERLRVTSASLTSNMALLDSRRSIDEAHAVTRLTELAFIFIPLSFAASVFGMQIKPLASPVPIWWFFVVAVAATSFSYAMRIFMRSQLLESMKTGIKADIRKYADKHGKPVRPRSLPVSLILQWGINLLAFNPFKIGKSAIRAVWIGCHWIYRQIGVAISFLLFAGIIVVLPAGILGTHNIGSGLQTALSLGMIIAVIFSLGVAFSMSVDQATMNTLWPRVFRREQSISVNGWRRVPGTSRRLRKLLLWLIPSITVLVIPMTILWTRPLATDIKIGASIGIVVCVLCVMAILGILHRTTSSRS